MSEKSNINGMQLKDESHLIIIGEVGCQVLPCGKGDDPSGELTTFRDKIDSIDDQIMKLLAERFKIVECVGRHKKEINSKLKRNKLDETFHRE